MLTMFIPMMVLCQDLDNPTATTCRGFSGNTVESEEACQMDLATSGMMFAMGQGLEVLHMECVEVEASA